MHLFLHRFSSKATSHLGRKIAYFLTTTRWAGLLWAWLLMAVVWAGLGHLSAQAQNSTIRYVSPQGAGNQTGTSWTNALPGTSLQTAINASRLNDQVWVAGGQYKPGGPTDTNRAVSFAMKEGVAIYGGFIGTETSLEQRPTSNPVADTPSSSTLSGDIGRLGDNTDNSYHVINNPASLSLTNTAILDGFVITGGNADNSSGSYSSGGGIYNDGNGSVCSPQIRHCTFVANSTVGLGGAMFNDGRNRGSSNPFLTNCAFVANASAYDGGAVYNTGQYGISSPTLINCAFIANTAADYGGAMVNEGTNGVSSPYLLNCTFLANSGGAMYNSGFDGNSSPRLTNCVLFGNGGTDTFQNGDGGSVTASYSLFDNTVTGYTDGGNNRTTTTSPFASLSSITLNTCGPAINAGSNQAYTDAGGPQTDLAGNPRIYPTGGRIDLGAVESQETAQPIAFIQQPPSASAVNVGGRVEVPVRVTGSVLGYQWYKDGQAVSGQISATLSLDYILTTDAGRYSVEVTGGCNSLTSTAFNLTIIRAIPIAGLSASPNSVVAGQPITFSATIDNQTETYSYTLANGMGSTLTGTGSGSAFSQTVRARGSGPQTYTLTVAIQDARGSSLVDLTVIPGPAIADGPVCTDFINRSTEAGLGSFEVNSIYIVGQTIYAGTGRGLSISTDGGNTFTNRPVSPGSIEDESQDVRGVYVVGDTVYAAHYGGLSISTDGGQTFTIRSTKDGLGSNLLNGVYTVGKTVYVATQYGLSVSTDGGQTFTNRTNGGFNATINGIYAVDNMVYVGGQAGLNISTDGGQTFTTRTTANGLGGNQVYSVYAVGNTVYAGTFNGLSISTDGGQNFISHPLTSRAPNGENIVFAVYAVGRTIYAGGPGGLSISTDGGNTFDSYTQGLGYPLVHGVSTRGNRIYAATQGGLSYCTAALVPTLTNIAASPNPVQTGQPVTFTATVGGVSGSYSYTLSHGADTPLSGTATGVSFSQLLIAQSSGVQTFTLTVATGDGTATAITSLSVLAPPIALTNLAASPNPVATGQPVLFTATVGEVTDSYAYTLANGVDMPLSGTANNSSFTQALMASGSGVQTFTLTVAAENSTATATTALTVLAPSSGLTITRFKPGQDRVTGQSVGFTATLTGLLDSDEYSFTLTNGRAATPPLIARSIGPNFDQSVPVEGSGPQTYTLTVSSQKGNASATASIIAGSENVTLVRFAILGVRPVSCEVVSGGERQVRFTPQYVGTDGQPISFSVVNELRPTTTPGPYSLRLYTDNPTINLVASQGGRGEVRFVYNWLAACQGAPTPPQAPVSPGIPNQTLRQGQSYQLVLADYVTDPDGQTPQFTVQGLPAGLSLSEGLLSGTPLTTGTYPVSLTATDPGGLSIAVGFTLTVVPVSGAVPTFSVGEVSPVSCVLVDSVKQGYQVRFTPQYSGLTGQPISFSVVNELAATTNAGPYTLRLYADNPIITLKATQAGSPVEASFRYNWLAACPPVAVSPATFKLVGVTSISCEVIGGGERRVRFTPKYTGLDGTPVSFSVVNELLPTTAGGPYKLTLYTDNPTIILSAQQGSQVVRYGYNWLGDCTSPARLGTGEPVGGLQVRVLGNPVVGHEVVVEVSGTEGQRLQYELTDSRGSLVQRQEVSQAGRVERQRLSLGNQPAGLLLLRVSTPIQSQTIKLIKAD